jgi:hypothetical protein
MKETQSETREDGHEQRGKRAMFNYGYPTYQAEHATTRAGQCETDAQMGRLSAAFAQLLRPLTKPARALRRQPGTGRPVLFPGR